MSVPSPSLTALALVAGLAVAGLAAAQPARADSFSFGFSVGERDGWRGHRGHRGERHHKRHRHHHHPRGHRPFGPPPWAFHRPQPRYYAPHCQLVWSHWHQGFVTVCR